MDNRIQTAAEAAEDAAIPRVHEVHADACEGQALCEVPAHMQTSTEAKSPAKWAYERLILYIQNFEKQLDHEHEIALGFAGADAGVLRIEGMGYFDPDIVTFYGTDAHGAKTQLIQHVSQLAVMLRAMPKPSDRPKAARIGFRLAADLEPDADPAPDAIDPADAG